MKKAFKFFYSQIFNSFFPLLVVLFLIKIKNEHNVAPIFLLMNYANFYLLFSDYSSNIIFLKEAVNKGGINETTDSEIKQNIEHYLGIKCTFLMLGFIIWLALCLTVETLKAHIFSSVFSYSFIVGYNLNFYWIYMSSSKEYYFVISNFFSRISLLILIFVFLFAKFSFEWLMPLVGLISVFTSIKYFMKFCNEFNLKPFVNRKVIVESHRILKRDFYLMISTIFLMTPTLCLNFFSGYIKPISSIPIYGFSEKIFYLFRATLSIFINSIFPGLSNNEIQGKNKNKIYIFFYFFVLFGSFLLIVSKPYITEYLKFSATDTKTFNSCLDYFVITIILLSINVPIMLWALIKDILITKLSILIFFVSSVIIVGFFTKNTLIDNGLAQVLPKTLMISEGLILIGFVILYYKNRKV